jgi:alpha-L-rhamnosidase
MRFPRLLCDVVSKPVGLTHPQPNFSWSVEGPKGLCQSACQVRITRTGGGLLWDSGKIDSREPGLECGVRLPETALLEWQVRIWDEVGRASAWSPFEPFGTAFFSPESWPGLWLGFDAARHQLVHNRAIFELPPEAYGAPARLHVGVGAAAAGNQSLRMNYFEAFVNGARLGDDILSPGQIAPEGGRALVRSFDLGGNLRPGVNAVGLRHISSRISAVLVVHLPEGRALVVNPVDPGWRQHGQGEFASLWPQDGRDEQGGKGEVQDERMAFRGWADVPFSEEASWKAATLVRPPRVLSAQHHPPCIQALHHPLRVSEPLPGRFVVDFGQNTHGFARLRVRAGRVGQRITLRYAENILPDPRPAAEISPVSKSHVVEFPQVEGTLDWVSARNHGQKEADAQADSFILADAQERILAPRFSCHGFRFVEVSGLGSPLLAEDIDAVCVHSPVLSASRFSCSSAQLSKLHELSRWSMRTNLLSVPTDCPHRERNGWLGDALCVSGAECLLFDVRSFFDLWLTQIGDAQREDGFLPMIVPFGKPLDPQDLPWQSAVVLVAWDVWRASGDRAFLARHYQTMTRWWDFAARFADAEGHLEGGVIWGDWVSFPGQGATKPFLGNAYFARASDLLGRIARLLGRSDDALKFEAVAGHTRRTMEARYFAGGASCDNGTQSALAHALAFGLCPERMRAALEKALATEVERQGRITAGCLGTYVLLPALTACGRDDLVLRLALDATHNWGAWLHRCDATTGLETWQGDRSSSYNHPFLLGSLVLWLYRRLGGVSPLEPGYGTALVAPYFAPGLSHCEAAVETPRGLILTRWERQKGRICLNLGLPANMEAKVLLPGRPTASVASGTHTFSVEEPSS